MPRAEVLGRVEEASRGLVEEKGADCVLLGRAGMTETVRVCEEAVGSGPGVEWNGDGRADGKGKEGRVNAIDGVEAGVHFLLRSYGRGRGRVREGCIGVRMRGAGRGDRTGFEGFQVLGHLLQVCSSLRTFKFNINPATNTI
jgi:hypothetical protein